MKVNELAPKSAVEEISVKVIKVSEPRNVFGKDGMSHKVSDVLVGDESGTIIMTLWDNSINKVKEGETINIKNAFVSTFKGSMRLSLNKNNGSITVSEKEIENVNTGNNMSDKVVEEERRSYSSYGRKPSYRKRY
ncbi:single-stranded DNA-binding protein [Caldisphaera lagunensis]|uniref:single-stranded DNA-binding protein n=1 Tax=Caldisphaera lagunensis TaxID=200415 RepID=UPI000662B256|nr:single-stranded DNA-binding protein [Caldisphaera lagunensis]